MRGYGQGPDVRFEVCAGGLCVMQGNAESWPIDNSIAGRASHGVEWRSPAKDETISILRESCCGASYWQICSSRGTPGVRPWLVRQQTKSHNHDSSGHAEVTSLIAGLADDRPRRCHRTSCVANWVSLLMRKVFLGLLLFSRHICYL